MLFWTICYQTHLVIGDIKNYTQIYLCNITAKHGERKLQHRKEGESESHWEFWHIEFRGQSTSLGRRAFDCEFKGDPGGRIPVVAPNSVAKIPSLIFKSCFTSWLFKATFVNATDPLMQLYSCPFGGIWVSYRKKKKKSKMEPKKKIYTHFIYKLKNLVQMSCYI